MRDTLNYVHSYPYDTATGQREWIRKNAKYRLAQKLVEDLPMGMWHTIRLTEETRQPCFNEWNYWDEKYHVRAEVEEVRMRHVDMWEPPPADYRFRMYAYDDLTWHKLGEKAWGILLELATARIRRMARVARDALRPRMPKVTLFTMMMLALVISSALSSSG